MEIFSGKLVRGMAAQGKNDRKKWLGLCLKKPVAVKKGIFVIDTPDTVILSPSLRISLSRCTVQFLSASPER